MKRLTLTAILLILALLPLCAAHRTAGEARTMALNFFASRGLPSVTLRQAPLNRLLRFPSSSSAAAPYYLFNATRTGGGSSFVIISGDDSLAPVLGYGEGSVADSTSLPPNLQEWLHFYARQINLLSTHPHEVRAALPSQRATSCAPLIKANWTQYAPYNNLCPMYNATRRSIVGCVATSMSQIMNYYQYPVQGKGSHSYKWVNGLKDTVTLAVDYGEPYRWDLILDDYDSTTYTPEQAQAIALLSYHCGVAANMNYSATASGANPFNAMTGLIDHFGYNPNLHICYRDYYTSAEWKEIVFSELDAARPVMYSGSTYASGHMFVIDGYNNQGYVHANWGWGGLFNGYFVLDVLEPIPGSKLIYDQTCARYFCPTVMGQDEYEMYIDSLAPLPSRVTAGENFDLVLQGLYNYSYKTFTGNIVISLFDSTFTHETRLSTYHADSLKYFWGWSEYGLPLSIPRTLSDGTYTLAAYAQPQGTTLNNYIRLYRCSRSIATVTLSAGSATLQSLNNTGSYATATPAVGRYYIITTIGGRNYYLTGSDTLSLAVGSGALGQQWELAAVTSKGVHRFKEAAYTLRNAASGLYLKNRGELTSIATGDSLLHPLFINGKGLYAMRMSNDTVINEQACHEYYLSADTTHLTASGITTSIPTFIWRLVAVNGSGITTSAEASLQRLGSLWMNPDSLPLTLYDVTGRVVARTRGNLDASSLPQGIYILHGGGKAYKFYR